MDSGVPRREASSFWQHDDQAETRLLNVPLRITKVLVQPSESLVGGKHLRDTYVHLLHHLALIPSTKREQHPVALTTWHWQVMAATEQISVTKEVPAVLEHESSKV